MSVREGWIAGLTISKENRDSLKFKPRVFKLLTEGISVNSTANINHPEGKPVVIAYWSKSSLIHIRNMLETRLNVLCLILLLSLDVITRWFVKTFQNSNCIAFVVIFS